MNILFVILIWSFLYYLFFHPLNTLEWMESMMEKTWYEYTEADNDHSYL